jgi:hypothetical protein
VRIDIAGRVMRLRFSIPFSLAALAAAPCALAANAGDLQFVSFNADTESLALVSFVDIAPNTTFFLTDNEWTGSSFNTGESYHRWDSGSTGVAAGSVVVFTAMSTTSLASTHGTLSREAVAGSNNYGLSQTADTVYLYQGASATTPGVFITAITTGDLSTTDGSLAGTGLTVGVNAMQLRYGSDSADYTGARTGATTMSDYKPLVANLANWVDRGDGNFAGLAADGTGFAAPVPEPSWIWLALSGLGALALAGRGRRTSSEEGLA